MTLFHYSYYYYVIICHIHYTDLFFERMIYLNQQKTIYRIVEEKDIRKYNIDRERRKYMAVSKKKKNIYISVIGFD